MDEERRALERAVLEGDESARAALARLHVRDGLGWAGEVLPPGIRAHASEPGRYLDPLGEPLARDQGGHYLVLGEPPPTRQDVGEGSVRIRRYWLARTGALAGVVDGRRAFQDEERRVAPLEGAVRALLARDIARILVDASEGSDLPSELIARLLSWQEETRQRGGRLALQVRRVEPVRTVFEWLQLAPPPVAVGLGPALDLLDG